MDVGRRHARVYEGVDPRETSAATAFHAPEGSSMAAEKGDRSAEGKQLLGVHRDVFAFKRE